MAMVGLVGSSLAAVSPSQADNTVPFAIRFQTNANGAITTIGNGLLSCAGSTGACTSARAGGKYDNNNFNMARLDADSDSSTYESSAAGLALPTGATVLWAGLYWGARLTAGSSGQAATGNRQQMLFKPPGAAVYQTVNSSFEFGPNTTSNNAYQEFAEVTSLVAMAGGGQYWGANVAAATGSDRYAGWTLTVVYQAPGLPLRNLSVFDGFDTIGSGTPRVIPVSGFVTPKSGPVDVQLGMMAYEGDLTLTGDNVLLNNTQLATTLSPGNNFFNSTVDNNGVSATDRTPAYLNNLGFDIKNLSVPGVIQNDARSASFTFSSSGDVYYPGLLTTSINLFAPDFTASSKSVVNLSGNNPARPGDLLQYTLAYVNYGQDAAVNSISRDPLSAGTAYVPGSLQLRYLLDDRGAPVAGSTVPLTDGSGDDQGDFDVGSQTVTVRLGQGASGASGGKIPVGWATAYSFQVTVLPTAGGTTVTNTASLDYQTDTTGVVGTYDLPPVSTPVGLMADVAITKSMSPTPAAVGGVVTSTLIITNNGPNQAQNVEVTDTLPIQMRATAVTVSTGRTCNPPVSAGATVDCIVGDLAVGATATVTIKGVTDANIAPGQLINLASVSATSFDPVMINNVASAIVSLNQMADLVITKTPDNNSVAPGDVVNYTVTVTNLGPSDARAVSLTDSVPDPAQLTLIGVTPGAGVTCPTADTTPRIIQCSLASLAQGASASFTVTAALATSLSPGSTVNNRASATAATPDPDTSNNIVMVPLTVGPRLADLTITKTAPATALAGGQISYKLRVINRGPSDATAVTVVDTLPPGVTITSASTSRGGACTITTTTVTCDDIGTLAGPRDPTTPTGASVEIQLAGTVSPDLVATTVLTNTATVTTTSTDPDLSDNSTTATSTVENQADVAVTKTGSTTLIPDPAESAPVQVSYIVTIKNLGPSTAHQVRLTDQLPAVLTYMSASPSQGSCAPPSPPTGADPAHSVLTCDIGDLAVGDSNAVTITITMQAEVGHPDWTAADLTEIATISSDNDPNPANDQATWTLTDQAAADLVALKSTTSQFIAGLSVQYDIGVYNLGPNPALPPLRLIDTLPDGVTFESSDDSRCSADVTKKVVTCVEPIMDIHMNETISAHFTAKIDPALAAGTILTNQLEVDSATDDPSQGNNTTTITNTVTTNADLAVLNLAVTNPGPPGAYNGPGSNRSQTFTIANNGPSLARHVEFRTNLAVPAGITAWPTGTVGDGSDCLIVSDELICAISNPASPTGQLSDLGPGQSIDILIPATLAAYVTPGTYPANGNPPGAYVEVISTTFESNLTNNRATAALVVGDALTRLQLTKTALTTATNSDGHSAFIAGSFFTYQLKVSVDQGSSTDPGAADAADVVVNDALPTEFTAMTANTDLGTCSIGPGGSSVSCTLGTVKGVSETAQPVVTITISGQIGPHQYSDGTGSEDRFTNTATATSTTHSADDPSQAATATASATADLIRDADLRQYKRVEYSPIYPGSLAAWTLTSVNAGPSAAGQVKVTDHLQIGLTFDPTNSDSRCTAMDDTSAPLVDTGFTPPQTIYPQIVTCDLGLLQPGESVSARIAVTINANGHIGSANTDLITQVVNQARLYSPADPDPDDFNTSTPPTVTPVQLLCDMWIATNGTGTATTAGAGSTITYSISGGNFGPSVCVDPVSVVVFPAGFVLRDWTTPLMQCTKDQTPTSPPQDRLTCTAIAALPWGQVTWPGDSVTGTAVVEIPPDAPAGAYSLAATTQTSTAESDLTNNSTTVDLAVAQVADLAMTKTRLTDPVTAGRNVAYRLDLVNYGPAVAPQVTVADQLPVGASFVNASRAGGGAVNCTASTRNDNGSSVSCALGTMAVGQSLSIELTISTERSLTGDLVNWAMVGSAAIDPDSSNNEDSATGPVEPGSTDPTTPSPSGPAGPGSQTPSPQTGQTGPPTSPPPSATDPGSSPSPSAPSSSPPPADPTATPPPADPTTPPVTEPPVTSPPTVTAPPTTPPGPRLPVGVISDTGMPSRPIRLIGWAAVGLILGGALRLIRRWPHTSARLSPPPCRH